MALGAGDVSGGGRQLARVFRLKRLLDSFPAFLRFLHNFWAYKASAALRPRAPRRDGPLARSVSFFLRKGSAIEFTVPRIPNSLAARAPLRVPRRDGPLTRPPGHRIGGRTVPSGRGANREGTRAQETERRRTKRRIEAAGRRGEALENQAGEGRL